MTGKRRKKVLIRIILDFISAGCLLVAVFSGYKLYQNSKEYREGENTYDTIRESVYEGTFRTDYFDDAEIREKVFSNLKKQNSDFVGWIHLADSSVDYPFVQTDNNDFYLYHLFNGEYNRSGCVFMDMENSEDFTDRNTILYAHHMRNGTMFHDIVNYEKQEYYNTHKIIRIDTLYESYDLYPVAGIFTTGDEDYLRIHFDDDEDFLAYLSSFLDHSTFQSEETINGDDRMVLLSTCAYNVNDGRYALIGKLVKK